MSSEWDQTCLVCGIKTESRCSSCAKAGIDLFFCSPDHQKLIWKTHRRVCGPGKANPLLWPLLSQHEADEIIAHMHDSTGLFAQPDSLGNSMASAMRASGGLEPEQVAALVRTLTAGAPNVGGVTLMEQQRVLGNFRAFEIMRQTTSHDTPVLVPCHDPLATLSFDELATVRPDRLNLEPWRTKYRHLMLAQFSLLGLWDRTAGQEPPFEWLERIVERVNFLVHTEIEPTQPRVAEKLLTRKPSRASLAARLASYGGPAA